MQLRILKPSQLRESQWVLSAFTFSCKSARLDDAQTLEIERREAFFRPKERQ
jgi:hypothetical protein